jgi:hypothetical protein
VIAARDLVCGDELLLNYGVRPLQDFLQGYGFVPHNFPHEVVLLPPSPPPPPNPYTK